eukprot:TRINITY_DN872_c0_g1_i1.p1 TRINITY_DN872_c0_g1~~TRINITY_DN872_c0_g1_i1.p1  ORF type:complete len:210 (+),score=20.74 TRINITY_DN872_c0_g1_i1:52-681(+)
MQDAALLSEWVPATCGRRWHGDDGVSYPPVKHWLAEHGISEILGELERHEVFTLDTLMLLTEEDLVTCFTAETQMKLANALNDSNSKHTALSSNDGVIQNTQAPMLTAVLNVIPQSQNVPLLTMVVPQLGMNSVIPFQSPTPSDQLFNAIQQLVEERERARRVKEYAKADFIREQLRKQGIKLNDDSRTWTHPNGTIGGSWGRQDLKVR